jgi:hypothetical protein
MREESSSCVIERAHPDVYHSNALYDHLQKRSGCKQSMSVDGTRLRRHQPPKNIKISSPEDKPLADSHEKEPAGKGSCVIRI